MILYKKVFPLGKDISFFQCITAIRKSYFSNYVITLDKIPSTENYLAQIFFTASSWRWSWRNGYYERVFLKECTIQYSESERYFTLQGSPRMENLLFASIQVLLATSPFVLAIFTIATNGSIPLNNIFGLSAGIILMLAPLIGTYLQDKKLLDQVGSIGKELEII
jgi:hypothetical protein